MIITMPERKRRLLREEARRLGISVSELVRRCVDAQVGAEGGITAPKDAYLSITGLWRGDGNDVAGRHHEVLREVLGKRRGRLR